MLNSAFLRASAVANNMLEKPLGSLGYIRNEDCFQEHLFKYIHSGLH